MLPLLISYTYLLISTNIYIVDAATGKSIFILAGQSNMSGRGGVVNLTWDGYVPRESSPNPSILRLSANLSWELAVEPLHCDIDVAKVCGVGPGMAFANSLLRKDAEAYKKRLHRFFEDVRVDLRLPLLPIVQDLRYLWSLHREEQVVVGYGS
ncbi:putative sialate O-acetylesterase domain, SGNH hydrolase superfamily [Helianthus annuus]|nr:putative sialate O-acetylesterase domain, SGNH hydrolase superfamily [Helianthus annuus]